MMTSGCTAMTTGDGAICAGLDVARIRQDFPLLHQLVSGKPLVYLDNAATTQKPRAVIDAITHYYTNDNANIHRGVHRLSVRATDAYEAARAKVQQFIGADRPEEIIFVRGATEAINLVAQTFGRSLLGAGDEIVISHLEHHSNIVPWQLLCEQTGAVLRVIPINDAGELMIDEYERMLTARVKIVAINHVSNALGTINPIARMIRMARWWGILFLRVRCIRFWRFIAAACSPTTCSGTCFRRLVVGRRLLAR